MKTKKPILNKTEKSLSGLSAVRWLRYRRTMEKIAKALAELDQSYI